MPLNEITAGFFYFIGRFLLALVEIGCDIVILWPGRYLCRLCGYRVDLNSWTAALVGIVFWCALGAVVYAFYPFTPDPAS